MLTIYKDTQKYISRPDLSPNLYVYIHLPPYQLYLISNSHLKVNVSKTKQLIFYHKSHVTYSLPHLS